MAHAQINHHHDHDQVLCAFVFFLSRASLFLDVLMYFLLFVLSYQYQCKWLPIKTRL